MFLIEAIQSEVPKSYEGVLDAMKRDARFGVCLDTAHIAKAAHKAYDRAHKLGQSSGECEEMPHIRNGQPLREDLVIIMSENNRNS